MKFFILIFLFVFLLSYNVTAFGLVSPPLDDTNNSIFVPQDATRTFTLGLQNLDKEDLLVKITIGSEENVAKIIGEEYVTVPGGSISHPVILELTAPDDAEISDLYAVSFTATPEEVIGAGSISFKIGYSKKFDVKIVKNPEKFYLTDTLEQNKLMWPVLLAIIALAIWFKYNEKSGKKSVKKTSKKRRRRK